MDNYVKGKIVIITGASGGFGLLAAKRIAQLGGTPVLAARDEAKLKAAVEEIKAAGGEANYKATDVSKREDVFDLVKFTVDTYGRVDVLVNNTGIMPLVFLPSMKRALTSGKPVLASLLRRLCMESALFTIR